MKNYIKIIFATLLAIPMAQLGMNLPLNINNQIATAAKQGNVTFLQNPLYTSRFMAIKDGDNNNLLHMAAANGQLAAVQYLAEHTVSKVAQNKQRQTPADIARAHGHQAVVAYLSGTSQVNQPATPQAPVQPVSQRPQPTPPVAQRTLPMPPPAPVAQPAQKTSLPSFGTALGVEINHDNMPKGLHNGTGGLGNRCFINAAVQCLARLEDVTVVANTTKELYAHNQLIQQYMQLMQEMKSSNNGTLDPQSFCHLAWNAIHANPGQQHDSVELVQEILNQLMEPTKNNFNNPLREKYTTAIASTILGGSSQTINETVVPLTIPGDAKKLEDCLAVLSDVEMVELDGLQQPKILHVENTSKYLILSLKRNIYKSAQKNYEKNKQPIAFPLRELCMTPYAQKNMPNYALIACIVHVGDAGGGHYCAYTKYANDWYSCDDNSITKITTAEMQTIANRGYGSTPHYLPIALFYERE